MKERPSVQELEMAKWCFFNPKVHCNFCNETSYKIQKKMGGNKCVDLTTQKKASALQFWASKKKEETHRLEKCQLVRVYVLVPWKATRKKKTAVKKVNPLPRLQSKASEIIEFGDDRGVFSNCSISSWKRKIAQGFLVAQFWRCQKGMIQNRLQ